LNRATVLDFLRAEYGVDVDASYYTRIDEWLGWWKGVH